MEHSTDIRANLTLWLGDASIAFEKLRSKLLKGVSAWQSEV